MKEIQIYLTWVQVLNMLSWSEPFRVVVKEIQMNVAWMQVVNLLS